MPNPKNKSQIDSVNFRKNFLWNFIGSTASAFVSLFYMMVVTRVNGIDDAGIFSFAFSTAAFFLVIGTYSGRTFQVTDKNHKTTDSDYFYLKFVTCIAMLLVGLVFCFMRGYAGEKFIVIMFLIFFRILEVIAECAYAVIQKHDRLYQVGRSMFIKAATSLAGFFVIDLLTQNLVLACALIIFANLLTMVLYDLPKLLRANFRFEAFRADKVWLLLKVGFFIFAFNFLNFYVVNAARYVLDSTASSDVQAVYGIIAMPVSVLSLAGQYLIQPFLTSFKKFFASDIRAFQNLVVQLCLALIGIGALCILCAWLLGIPVLELLYALELDGALPALLLILLGGTFSVLVAVISTALITMRRTGDQFWIYVVVSVCAFFLAQNLVARLGVFGASLSYMLSMCALFVLYAGVFAWRLRQFKQNPKQGLKHAATE